MIEIGDSIAKVKSEINAILEAADVDPAVSWGDAHTKLNLLGAGLTANMGGEEAREKINALIEE